MKLKRNICCMIALLICVTLIVPIVNMTSSRVNSEQPKKIQKNTVNKKLEDDSYKVKGFSQDEVAQAKLIVERVMYQLQEITSSENGTGVASPDVPTAKKEEKDDISKYKEISSKIDEKLAINLLVKLNKDFGGMEKVMDEYLYSIQIGVDLNLYITNKKLYLKQKEEKSIGIDSNDVITMAKIESKMIEVTQKRNKEKIDAAIGDKEKGEKGETKTPENETDKLNKTGQVENPVPDINNVKPENPLDSINKEINGIKERSFGVDVKSDVNEGNEQDEKK